MKIGYAYVVADIVHIGHIRYLESVKGMCDKLIVGVLTNEACMEKKPKPAISFKDRFETVAALKCVDCVVTQDTYSPLPNVRNLRPNILFESTSHDSKALKDAENLCLEINCRLIVVPYFSKHSSTQIKERIKHDK